MEATVNQEMIVLGRDLLGITQEHLASKLGVTQATLSRYESGLLEFPREMVKDLANHLKRPESFFYWREKLYAASCLYHRRNRRISAGELRIIHAKVNLLRMQASRLLKKASVKSNYAFHRLDPTKYGGPEGCAMKLRQLWQLPNGPIRHVIRTIESAGGMVFRCPFGQTRVDGISQWPLDDSDMPPIFFVHDDITGDRARLTLSHEIGHVVMHHAPTGDDIEDEANLFASEFLMPAEEIGPELRAMTLPKAAALKSYWKVSMQAIIVRARQLKRITAEQYTYLFRQLSVRGYRKCEPNPIPPEEPDMFRDLLHFCRTTLGEPDSVISLDYLGELLDSYHEQYGHNFANFRLVG